MSIKNMYARIMQANRMTKYKDGQDKAKLFYDSLEGLNFKEKRKEIQKSIRKHSLNSKDELINSYNKGYTVYLQIKLKYLNSFTK